VPASSSGNDFNDAETAFWAFVDSIGVRNDRLKALIERLETDFRAADGGYATLEVLELPLRAVASDQILGGAQAAIDNLVEACLHKNDASSLLAAGEKMSDAGTVDSWRVQARRDMALIGFFRAMGSTLDCLAASTIGILRLPYSIRRAAFSQLLNLPNEVADEHPVWRELADLIYRNANEPTGWLHWALQMRHALMHRPRLMAASCCPASSRSHGSGSQSSRCGRF
jgi:hypothetical protein